MINNNSEWIPIAHSSDLREDEPLAATADGIELVVVQSAGAVHVMYGRCPHRGALMAHGCVCGASLECKAHGWDFSLETGVSRRVPGESLGRFTARTDTATGEVLVSLVELRSWRDDNPQAFSPDEFL